MSPKFVFDENLRGRLWRAVCRHNTRQHYKIDVVRVGDEDGPPLGISDEQLLAWAANAGRILVSLDRSTLPGFLVTHLAAGNHSAGVFIIREGFNVPDLIEHLVLVAWAADAWEFRDLCEFIP